MSRTPLIKRRLNPFLIAAIVAVLALLAGLSVFYQGNLHEVLVDKQDIQEELNETKQDLESMETENERLESNLTELQDELHDTEVLLNSTQDQNEQLESEISNLEDDKESLESEVSQQSDRIEELETRIEDICLSGENINMTESAENWVCQGIVE